LIELLISLVILAISLLALASLMAMTTQNNSFGSHMTEATTLAQDQLENLRVTPWANVVTGADPLPIAGSTGIPYTRSWTVAQNADGTLRAVTITITWTDRTGHSIRLLSAIPQ